MCPGGRGFDMSVSTRDAALSICDGSLTPTQSGGVPRGPRPGVFRALAEQRRNWPKRWLAADDARERDIVPYPIPSQPERLQSSVFNLQSSVFRRTSGNLQYSGRLPSASLKVDGRSSRRNERISRQAEGQNRSHAIGRSAGAWHEASAVSRQLRPAARGSPRPGRPGMPAKRTVIMLMMLAGLAAIASTIH